MGLLLQQARMLQRYGWLQKGSGYNKIEKKTTEDGAQLGEGCKAVAKLRRRLQQMELDSMKGARLQQNSEKDYSRQRLMKGTIVSGSSVKGAGLQQNSEKDYDNWRSVKGVSVMYGSSRSISRVQKGLII